MRFCGLCIAASIVALSLHFCCKIVILTTWQESQRCDQGIACPTHLLESQQFAAEDVVAGRDLLENSNSKQLAQDRHVHMPGDAAPPAAFKVMQAQLFFAFSKTIVHRPPSKGHPQRLSQRPALTPRYSTEKEVLVSPVSAFHPTMFLQWLFTNFSVLAFAETCLAKFPDLAITVCNLDVVTLSSLLGQRR